MDRRVIKLGGSLLSLPDIGATFESWLAEQSPAQDVIVAGGGDLADAIRRIDAMHPLDVELAHWLCVDTLAITARLAAQLLPGTTHIARWEELVERLLVDDRPGKFILDPGDFLRRAEPQLPGEPLPIGWQVTSDSIAARLAAALDADELVLLKSAPAPNPPLRRQAAKIGLVDTHFPTAADSVKRVRVVNFRSSNREECVLVERV